MNISIGSSGIGAGHISEEVQVNILRKTLDERQSIAMEIINKNAEISKKIQEEPVNTENLIDYQV